MEHSTLGLLGIIIALLGIGGGRLWSDKRIEDVRIAMKKIKVDILGIHERCHTACKDARMAKEEELEHILEKSIKPKLQLGNLIMLELCERAGVPKEKVEEFRKAIFNDSTIQVLKGK